MSAGEEFLQGLRGDRGDRPARDAGVLADRSRQPDGKPDGEHRGLLRDRDPAPGAWHQGDFAEWTEHGGLIIHGRSDATLNPGGVRIGTAEIYRQVEQVPEVAEAIAVGQDHQGDTRIVLFVVLKDGEVLDDTLADRIRRRIRENTTPRHVPAKVVAVPEIPRTRSGKITELAVRAVIHGDEVRNVEALANPEALDHYRDLPDLAD